MSSNSREGIERDFAALHGVVSRILGHSYGALTTPERLGLLGKIEHETRRLGGPLANAPTAISNGFRRRISTMGNRASTTSIIPSSCSAMTVDDSDGDGQE
jgi:hypothetical protein